MGSILCSLAQDMVQKLLKLGKIISIKFLSGMLRSGMLTGATLKAALKVKRVDDDSDNKSSSDSENEN